MGPNWWDPLRPTSRGPQPTMTGKEQIFSTQFWGSCARKYFARPPLGVGNLGQSMLLVAIGRPLQNNMGRFQNVDDRALFEIGRRRRRRNCRKGADKRYHRWTGRKILRPTKKPELLLCVCAVTRRIHVHCYETEDSGNRHNRSLWIIKNRNKCTHLMQRVRCEYLHFYHTPIIPVISV